MVVYHVCVCEMLEQSRDGGGVKAMGERKLATQHDISPATKSLLFLCVHSMNEPTSQPTLHSTPLLISSHHYCFGLLIMATKTTVRIGFLVGSDFQPQLLCPGFRR